MGGFECKYNSEWLFCLLAKKLITGEHKRRDVKVSYYLKIKVLQEQVRL